ncbi:MAG TPA: hydrogenase [bacterium]|nr:hydrogenase [bacterium]
MITLLDSILFLLILTDFVLLGSSRLRTCIKMIAVQGVITGLLGVATSESMLSLGILTIALKGFVFPYLLLRAMSASRTKREVDPFLGYSASLFAGILCIIVAFWLDGRLHLPVSTVSKLMVPVAFSTIMIGLLLIIARKTAISQVLGYLALENGIYIISVGIVQETPFLIELGVLLDVFVGVFVMGIAIHRISREFDHIDSDQLSTLRG